MTKHIVLFAAFVLAAPPVLAQQSSGTNQSGSVSTSVQQVEVDGNSAKYTEYRDLRDDVYVPTLRWNLFNTETGLFINLAGRDLTRKDQSIAVSGGHVNRWALNVVWDEIPHNFSNKAQTPYVRTGAGLFEVPATVPITFKKLATAAGDTAGVVGSDDLIAAYQATFLEPTNLALDTGTGRVALQVSPSNALRLAATYGTRRQEGLRPMFAPIGDRPPRSLNVQLTQPVDRRTDDLTLALEHEGARYLAQFEYLYSNFSNNIDTLTWQNLYATADAGRTWDAWDRAVSTYGAVPLSPDNRYHNISFGVAGDLPLESRLSARVAYGRATQNEPLLPYSYNSNMLQASALPRASADAEITTTQVFVDYVLNPVSRLNVRTWARYFAVDNRTAQSRWQYVTSDTPNLNGSVTFKNKRINLPYATDRATAGLDATWRLPARSSVSAGYERETLQRDYREADTTEDRLAFTLRARAARWANLRARYIFGDRRGDGYNAGVTRQSYWYALSEAGTDADNPAFTFSNHPDMRRFDVSDRRRHQFDLTANLTPAAALGVTAAIRYRMEEFDSGVTSVLPLAETGIGEVGAATPGDQLGLLENSRTQYSLDAWYTPVPRLTLNAFVSRDRGTTNQRGLEFNENNKANPSTIASAELGPWTRASSQWTTDFDDVTWTGGVGGSLQIVPERVTVTLNYAVSLADVDIAYGGFGVTNWNGAPFAADHQFAFTSPPTIAEDLHVTDLRFEVPLVGRTTMFVGYSYQKYRLDDWQQQPSQLWVEAVGSEFLLRDTSRSFQWGNRLFNLGTPLAPSYTAHLGWAGVSYRF